MTDQPREQELVEKAVARAFRLFDDFRPLPSYNDLAERAGVDAPSIRPGQCAMDVLVTAQLYWPRLKP